MNQNYAGSPESIKGRPGKIFRNLVIFLSLIFLVYCSNTEDEASLNIHYGDLKGQRGGHYHYIQGDVIDCRNLTVDYLQGAVRGDRSRGIFINVMKGNIENGGVTVNVLEGDIIRGEQATVNLLIGEDFSGQAKIQKLAE